MTTVGSTRRCDSPTPTSPAAVCSAAGRRHTWRLRAGRQHDHRHHDHRRLRLRPVDGGRNRRAVPGDDPDRRRRGRPGQRTLNIDDSVINLRVLRGPGPAGRQLRRRHVADRQRRPPDHRRRHGRVPGGSSSYAATASIPCRRRRSFLSNSIVRGSPPPSRPTRATTARGEPGAGAAQRQLQRLPGPWAGRSTARPVPAESSRVPAT